MRATATLLLLLLARLAVAAPDEAPAEVLPSGWWVAPLERLRLTGTLFDVAERPYSTAVRPRNVAGSISIACERQEGRPCGDGAAGFVELDSAAGYGRWLRSFVRLRAQAGEHVENTLVLDRAFVAGELGPLAAEVGRAAIVLGPSARTQLGWGTNAPPITHVRLSTSRPLELASSLRGSATWIVGRLRAPQRYPHALISIARVQLDVGKNLELGTMQLLQLGGDGAPQLGFWDFLAEHVRRKDLSATATDTSNRRFGGDIAFRIPELGARLYYVLIFEDIRRARFIDAFRYDADHLFGIELPAVGGDRRYGLVLEWHQTGFRSQEHSPRTTGFTNLGRVVGSPLGPDATSVYAGGRVELPFATAYPWIEVATLSSDTYEQITKGPINRLAHGPSETRYRAGSRVDVTLTRDLLVAAELVYEHVTGFAFEPAASRNNVGLVASVFWHPRFRLRTR